MDCSPDFLGINIIYNYLSRNIYMYTFWIFRQHPMVFSRLKLWVSCDT